MDNLRNEVGVQMWKYNFDTMLWKWGGLGQMDVLRAMQAGLSKADFEAFYWQSMAIALHPLQAKTE